MTQAQTIQWQGFSKKHKEYIKSALKNRMCVAEGAIRSGKTIDHCIIAQMYLEICPDRIHLASGSSMPNAKLNIGDCNGFGLEYLFRGRCKWGKYKSNEALYLNTKTGEKVVIFVGGGKRNSYQKILGNSYGLWIATEANEHYDSDDSRESFIKVAFGRQIAAQRPLVLWDFNPCNPNHKIYSDYVDKYKEGLEGGYLYRHFTIDDNLSITPERKREIESQRGDCRSVWYRRDILGERCIAEGLIYQTFADNPERFLTETPQFEFINIGVDFGGNKSATTFVATGIDKNRSTITALCSERHSERHDANGLTPLQLYEKLDLFIQKVEALYGFTNKVYADCAEPTLINGMRKHISVPVRESIKGRIVDRIRATLILMAAGRFYYTKDCETLVRALQGAVYNPKSMTDERLDDGTSDIDTLDAFEYSWSAHINRLVKA